MYHPFFISVVAFVIVVFISGPLLSICTVCVFVLLCPTLSVAVTLYSILVIPSRFGNTTFPFSSICTSSYSPLSSFISCFTLDIPLPSPSVTVGEDISMLPLNQIVSPTSI